MSADENLQAPERGRHQAIEQIAALLSIDGGNAPATIDEFWYQVAVAMKVGIPADGITKMGMQIFAKLDEEWDEDYLSDDGEGLSLEAYETLYDVLKTRPPADTEGVEQPSLAIESDDEEDDSIGPVDISFDSRAETTQTDVDTTLNRIKKGTLILNPDWQRDFVWKLKKQRRLVESVLLGLPIPSLLLFRASKSGKTYVIDGRQRLETISRFRAPKPEKGAVRKRFRTFSAKTEGWRPGEKLNAAANKYYDDLPDEFKSKFDSTTLVLHTFVDLPSDKLYQIFRRYNTGAEQLKAAEIRNAVYQASTLHAMMYRIAGENGIDSLESDDERTTASTLRHIMKNKTQRYGAYDFVGRYFAFAYMTNGSVANATNDFMIRHDGDDVSVFRDEFIRVFTATCDWYEYPLIAPSDDGKFHAFLATIQMVSTKRMLECADAGTADENTVRAYIATSWNSFAVETLEQKQNSTAFWNRQKDWIALLEQNCLQNAGLA